MSDDLCPMCKKHKANIIKRKTMTVLQNTTVEHDETVYFCSFLGEDDPDAYFIPPRVMNENLLAMMKAYEKIRPLTDKDKAYITKLEAAVNKENLNV